MASSVVGGISCFYSEFVPNAIVNSVKNTNPTVGNEKGGRRARPISECKKN